MCSQKEITTIKQWHAEKLGVLQKNTLYVYIYAYATSKASFTHQILLEVANERLFCDMC